jgi:hypothetical protein
MPRSGLEAVALVFAEDHGKVFLGKPDDSKRPHFDEDDP